MIPMNQSPLSRFKSNKAGLSRSASELKSITESTNRKDGSPSPSVTQQLDLKEGQTIKGQIIDLRRNEVRVQIEPGGQIVTAKLIGDLFLSIGQEAQFLVTEGSSDFIALKYLSDPSADSADATVNKALSASGFTMTARNKAIVEELLKHRMPVDKQTLQTLIMFAHKNRETSPLTLVLMYKNQFPMTSANIKQFESYQNGTNQLLGEIHNIAKKIPELLKVSEVNQEGFSDHVGALLNQNTFPQSRNDIPLELQQSETQPWKEVIQINEQLTDLLLVNREDAPAMALPSNQLSELPNLTTLLTPKERSVLLDLMDPFSPTDQLKQQIVDGTATVKEVLSFLRLSLPQIKVPFSKALLQSREYSSLLEEAFRQKWTITPEKLSQKDSTAKLFEDLTKDMEKINELITKVTEEKELPIKEPIKNIRDNLHFIKDLNEVFTYIPLPIQFKDKDIHSDLYVLTKKKAPRDKKEPIRVLLHLAMDHLGPTNIDIQMQQNQISTKFYLSDPEAVPLLKEHLPTLTEALNKKGYSITTELISNYEKPDFCKDFIEQNTSENEFQRYTFDIRT